MTDFEVDGRVVMAGGQLMAGAAAGTLVRTLLLIPLRRYFGRGIVINATR